MARKKREITPKSPRRRAKAAIVGYYLHLAAVASYAVLLGVNLSRLAAHGAADPLADAYMVEGFEPYVLAFGLSAMAHIATLVVVVVLFMMWIHRTNRNAHTLAPGMDISPAWAVGWFFVPFASLWKPFEGVEQTWQVSTDPTRWKALDTPRLLRWWWGLYLGGNITGALSGTIGKSGTVGGHIAGELMALLSCGLVLAGGLVTIRVIRQLTERQVTALGVAAFA